MLQKLGVCTLFTAGVLSVLTPAAGLARDHGGSYRGRGYSGQRNYAAPRIPEGRRGYYGHSYVAPRYYSRPSYRGYYGGGVYFGYSAPYTYTAPYTYYAPGYSVNPGYSYAPDYAPRACTAGSYDQYGNWLSDPNCAANSPQYQQQYAQPQQPQYPQPENQQQPYYSQPQVPQPQSYDPYQRYQR